MRSTVIAVVVVACAVGGAAWWWMAGRGAGEAPRYDTAAVDRGRIVAKATASGTLSALVPVQVGSQVSGRILELAADWNANVHKGDVLARIDPQLFQAAVDQARANVRIAEGNLAKAQAQAEDAQRQLARQQSLFDQRIATRNDLDTAVTAAAVAAAAVTVAEGGLQQAQAALSQASANLGYTVIRSPVDGMVVSRSVDVGQTVAASLQAPTLFTIAEDLRKMQVDTNVAEADVGKLSPGMSASFYVDAYPGETFAGTIRQVRNAAQVAQNVVTYDAVIDVDNPELKLRPGMTANVTFVYAERDDVLRVPNSALRFRPPATSGGEARRGGGDPARRGGDGKGRKPETDARARTVWVLRDGAPQPVRVRVGLSDGSLTEVLDGELKDGDAAITEAIGGAKPRPAAQPPRRML